MGKLPCILPLAQFINARLIAKYRFASTAYIEVSYSVHMACNQSRWPPFQR